MTKDIDEFAARLQEEILDQVREHYSETVLDHWLNPRNHGEIENANGPARVTGPCGDAMEIFIVASEDRIVRARFLTNGCMTTFVAASMAVELAMQHGVAQALALSQADILAALGGLPAANEHCALLAANTLHAAIEDYLRTRGAEWKRLYRSG